MVKFGDGAVISYDKNNHALVATLPEGGTTALTSPGGITLTGDTQIKGNLQVSKNTTISGNTHSEGAVTCDKDVSDSKSSMQSMRETYNGHSHKGNVPPPSSKME